MAKITHSNFVEAVNYQLSSVKNNLFSHRLGKGKVGSLSSVATQSGDSRLGCGAVAAGRFSERRIQSYADDINCILRVGFKFKFSNPTRRIRD